MNLNYLKSQLCKVLFELDLVCRENNICYSLHGGTLLGAERNGQFIPWDDDVDISMTRMNYERLKNVIAKNNRSNNYIDESSFWTSRYVHIIDGKEYYIDLFIWDYISEIPIVQRFKILLLHFLQGILKERPDYTQYNGKYKALIVITGLIGRLISKESKLRLYKKISKDIFTGNHSMIHRSNDSFKGVAAIYDCDFMLEYTDIFFEGNYYMVNKRYKEFLVEAYGTDYIIPPDINNRKTKHFTE